MIFGMLSVLAAITAQSREYPFWVAMGFIVFAQRQQGDFRQGYRPVQSTLSAVNMHEPPVGENIFYLKCCCFSQTQSHGI